VVDAEASTAVFVQDYEGKRHSQQSQQPSCDHPESPRSDSGEVFSVPYSAGASAANTASAEQVEVCALQAPSLLWAVALKDPARSAIASDCGHCYPAHA
jgi:hypothetical protein